MQGGLMAPAPAPLGLDLDVLAALLAVDPSLAEQLAQLAPGAAPSAGPSRLAALLAADPALRALLPAAPGAPQGSTNVDDQQVAPSPISAGPRMSNWLCPPLKHISVQASKSGLPDGAATQVSYDVWGRAVSDPAAERAADAAENAQPLALTRSSDQDAEAAREAEVARLRAEQRAWWDAELAKARQQTHGHVAVPVRFLIKGLPASWPCAVFPDLLCRLEAGEPVMPCMFSDCQVLWQGSLVWEGCDGGMGTAQVDLSHTPGAPQADEAHPVLHHAAVDMAQEPLRAGLENQWQMKDEIFNYRERIEWRQSFVGRPAARRYPPSKQMAASSWPRMHPLSRS
jgi:hypothetical protein